MDDSQPLWLLCFTINGNFRAKGVKNLAILVSVGLPQDICKTNKNIDKHFMMLFLYPVLDSALPGLFHNVDFTGFNSILKSGTWNTVAQCKICQISALAQFHVSIKGIKFKQSPFCLDFMI